MKRWIISLCLNFKNCLEENIYSRAYKHLWGRWEENFSITLPEIIKGEHFPGASVEPLRRWIWYSVLLMLVIFLSELCTGNIYCDLRCIEGCWANFYSTLIMINFTVYDVGNNRMGIMWRWIWSIGKWSLKCRKFWDQRSYMRRFKFEVCWKLIKEAC